jgi:hypothetical protein
MLGKKLLINQSNRVGSVQVALRNQGPDAFKPEVFGETIIIERKLSKEGQSGYRILNKQSRPAEENRFVYGLMIASQQRNSFQPSDSC